VQTEAFRYVRDEEEGFVMKFSSTSDTVSRHR
jgi:hypothetical protein